MSLTTRISEGMLRILIVIIHAATALFFCYKGIDLIRIGVRGEWKIVADFKDVPLYITSISPGVFVVLAAVLIMCWGLPKTINNLK